MTTQTIFVTGATGNVGRHVATQLTEAGITVRALSRDPSSPRLPAGVTAVRGDLTDPDSVRNAAAGADAAFLVWPFLTAQGAEAAVRAIAGGGYAAWSTCRRSPFTMAPRRKKTACGATSSRPSGSTRRNGPSCGLAASPLTRWRGRTRPAPRAWSAGPTGQAARSLIHERDIADVAVRVLADGKHAGASYVLTGPQAVTRADQVCIIGEVTGLPARWDEASPAAVREQLAAITGDRAFADHAMAYWAQLIDQPEPVTHTVEEITGTRARTFREWAREHARDFFSPGRTNGAK